MAAETEIYAERLHALGEPGGAVYVHFLRLLMRMDTLAKAKLSGDMVKVRTGNLRSSQAPPVITVQVGMITGILQNTAKYAEYVHDGTKPHEIRPLTKKYLTGWVYDGAPVFTKLVHHPGTTARPFLRTAMEEILAVGE